MITKLTVQNVKGINSTYELGRINLITGRNFSGKTGILKAITLALIGYDPALGSSNQSTYELASGRELRVLAEHLVATRTWTTELVLEKIGAKVSLIKGPADADLAPSCMLDLSEYFGMTAAKRAAYVFSKAHIDPAVFGRQMVVDKLGEVDAASAGRKHGMGVVMKYVTQTQAVDQPLPEWLAGFIDEAKLQAKMMKASVADDVGAIRTMVMGESQVVDRVTAAEVQKQADLLAAQRAKLNAALAAYDNHRKLQQEENSLNIWLESHPEDPESLPEDHLSLLDERISQNEKAIKAMAELSTAEADAIMGELNALHMDMAARQERCKALERRRNDVIEERDTVLDHDHCPLCLAEGTGWNEKFTAKSREEQEKVTEAMHEEQRLLTDLREKKERLTQAYLSATNANADIRANGRAANILNASLRKEVTATKERMEIRKRSEARLLELRPMLATGMSDVEISEMTASVHALDAHLHDLRLAANNWQAAESRKLAISSAENTLKVKEDALSAVKDAIDVLVILQDKLAQMTIGKLLGVARQFTNGILGFSLEYRDREFGYERNGRWVSCRTFSTTEQRLTFAGIQIAFAQDHPERVVLFDELGVLHSTTKVLVMERIRELVESGVIGQFVGVDTVADYADKTVKIIQC